MIDRNGGRRLGRSSPRPVDIRFTTNPAIERRGYSRTTVINLEHRMESEWNDRQPIYRQLRDRVVAMILDGVLKEGDPLPSVRNVAAESRVNPLTVLKAYQELVDEQLVETRRGLGMFVNAGAQKLLRKGERQKFLTEEWPRIAAIIQRLGLTTEELLKAAKQKPAGKKSGGSFQ
jgi:GntR family transcriptional regulator